MANNGKISISSQQPKGIPPKADFAIYVDFKKDSPNPQRVFQTVSDLITSFQKFDKVLCQTIDSSIEPIMMLEEVQLGSLKIWLRNALTALDDDGLKTLDWKPLVGKYLVRAKYLVVDFLNKAEIDTPEKISDFSKKLAKLASETDVKHLPDYKPPSLSELSGSLKEISDSKSHLIEGDKLSYLTDSDGVDFNLAINWSPEKFDEFLTKETIKYPAAAMILAVKKPDYLGNSQWELRHGKVPISARIEDTAWLKKFQNREIDVRPGDSLRCIVEQVFNYGYDNELISQEITIKEVTEVLANSYYQGDLLKKIDDESKESKDKK